jgi:hypothetical protein
MEVQGRKCRIIGVILLVVLMGIAVFTACNSKGQCTRSFKLTQDSTFIGAWGGRIAR